MLKKVQEVLCIYSRATNYSSWFVAVRINHVILHQPFPMTAFAQLYDVVGRKLGRRFRTTWVLDAGPVVFESTTHSLTHCCFFCCLDILSTRSYLKGQIIF